MAEGENEPEDAPLSYAPAFGEGRPWVIAVGIDEDSELGAAVADAAGQVVFIEGPGIPRLRQEEYDAVVAVGAVGVISPHLHVLQFGGRVGDGWDRGMPGSPVARTLRTLSGQKAHRFEVVEPSSETGRLVRDSMLANLPRGGDYDVLSVPRGGGRSCPAAGGGRGAARRHRDS